MKYDFTDGVQQAFATEQMKDINGKSVLMSGDLFGEGVIQISDYDCWATEPAAVQVYKHNDANLDGVVQVSDYEHWFVNRSKIGCVEICY